MTNRLKSANILIIVGGGIAAYKVLELIRRLKGEGAQCRVILTRAGREFVTPLSLATLSGNKVHEDMFDLTDETEIGHIQLARDCDLVVVAPATANLLAKMAGGIADDLATTALLATVRPVIAAPAMNTRMWNHAATRRNLAQLEKDGIHFVGPNEGVLAEGESGMGRMAEPEEILDAARKVLEGAPGPLTGKKIIVTSGPTHEALDPVRYIANRSSGKQGHAIAAALARLGADVVLVSGPVSIADPDRVETIHIESARDMLAAVEAHLPADAAICAAAVADWRADKTAAQKIKKDGKRPSGTMSLVENPDILATLAGHKTKRPRLVIGFAAETEKIVDHARAKLKKKRCDWIVANDVSQQSGIAGGVMGGDDNIVHLIDAQTQETWPRMSKQQVAVRLAERIAQALGDEA